jgi:hypothetical protein
MFTLQPSPVGPSGNEHRVVLAATAVTSAAPTLLSVKGGPIPQSSFYYDYRFFTTTHVSHPAQPLDAGVLTDGNVMTGVRLQGLDAVGSEPVYDTGTFALFEYQLDPLTTSVTVRAYAQVDYDPGSSLIE